MKNSKKVFIFRYSKGFTLIELLVVVSIISLLSSIVFAAVNNARTKGSDVAIKTTLNNARAQAELYYSNNSNSYSGVCDNGTTTDGTKSIYNQVLSAAKLGGLASISINPGSAGSPTTATCNHSANAWAAEVPLFGSATGNIKMWCVDSTNKSKQEIDNLVINDYACTP